MAEKLWKKGQPKSGGYYIYGLFAEGAHWNREKRVFEDVQPGRQGLVEALPVMHVEVVQEANSGSMT